MSEPVWQYVNPTTVRMRVKNVGWLVKVRSNTADYDTVFVPDPEGVWEL